MPYPVLLGGDHAQFEQEWAASGRPEHERPDWPLPSFDAQDWAQAFCKLNPGIDEGLMITWFANALMRGYDQRQGELLAQAKQNGDGCVTELWPPKERPNK